MWDFELARKRGLPIATTSRNERKQVREREEIRRCEREVGESQIRARQTVTRVCVVQPIGMQAHTRRASSVTLTSATRSPIPTRPKPYVITKNPPPPSLPSFYPLQPTVCAFQIRRMQF